VSSSPSQYPVPRRPRGHPLFGNLLQFLTRPAALAARAAEECGDVALLVGWPFRVYLFSHPSHVQEILVDKHRDFKQGLLQQRAKFALGEGLLTSEGDIHLQRRRLLQPAFHRDQMERFGNTIVEHALLHRDQWRPGEVVDLALEMRELTQRIAVEALLGTAAPAEIRGLDEALTTGSHYIAARAVNPFGPLFHRLPLPFTRRFQRALAEVNGFIDQVIAERRLRGAQGDDLLSMLLRAAEGLEGGDEWVRDEVMTFFMGGHATTAAALTWACYLLAVHPEAKTRLHQELDHVLGGRAPTVADLPALPYVAQVFREAIRLYPPAWIIGKTALRDTIIGGYRVPKGSLVFVSPLIVHRDPRWFPNPQQFLPERWTGDSQANVPPYAYFPFGGGPRQCIGEPFAWLEGVLALTTLAQCWDWEPLPDFPVEAAALSTLRPRFGLRTVLWPRPS